MGFLAGNGDIASQDVCELSGQTAPKGRKQAKSAISGILAKKAKSTKSAISAYLAHSDGQIESIASKMALSRGFASGTMQPRLTKEGGGGNTAFDLPSATIHSPFACEQGFPGCEYPGCTYGFAVVINADGKRVCGVHRDGGATGVLKEGSHRESEHTISQEQGVRDTGVTAEVPMVIRPSGGKSAGGKLYRIGHQNVCSCDNCDCEADFWEYGTHFHRHRGKEGAGDGE